MNKILLEDNTSLKDLYFEEDTIVIVNNITNCLNYYIKDNIRVFTLIMNTSLDLNLFIESDSICNVFSVNTSINVKIDLIKDSINFKYNYSTINSLDNLYNVDINHLSNNIHSKITSHGINVNDSKLSFVVNTVVPKESLNIKTNQDSKIIILGDNNSTIKPNLFIDNDDIEADHAAYIGKLKNEDLFYLESRGISEENSKKLLIKAFLMGNLDITYEEKEIVLEKINEYWR